MAYKGSRTPTNVGRSSGSTSSGHPAKASASMALVAVGVPESAADAAVVLIHRGVKYTRRKLTKLKRGVSRRLTQLVYGTEEVPHRDLTLVINGASGCGQFSAFLKIQDDPSYHEISAYQLRGISKLVSGNLGFRVRDMGGFTDGARTPLYLNLSLDYVFAILVQYWEYERFSEYNRAGSSVTIVKVRSRFNRSTVLRLTWDNEGNMDASRAEVFTEREWKSCPYRKGRKDDLDGFSDIDILQLHPGRSLLFL